MDKKFFPAIQAIYSDAPDAFASLLSREPELAKARSSCSHPTLLQLVACEESNVPNAERVTSLLIDAGAYMAGPLVAAAGCRGWTTLKTILARGEPVDRPNGWSALDEALYWRHRDIADFLLERGARVRCLQAASALGALDLVASFFEDGVLKDSAGPVRSPFPDTVPAGLASDPQAILDNAFVSAVNAGEVDAARMLLERGASVNAKPPGYHWRGTALHAACWLGDRPLVEWLLSIGADPGIRDDFVDADAVGWARHHGHDELEPLLERTDG